MPRRRRVLLPLLLPGLFLAAVPACQRRDPASAQARLESDFAARMSGSVLAGRFTSNKNDKIHQDRYTISKVSRLAGDVWVFQTRIQYGDHDVNVPVPVKILWAGDTPVITLTDAGIPGLGSFTARVLFYRDEYAGTWSNSGGGGGQMFGKIEKAAASEPPAVQK